MRHWNDERIKRQYERIQKDAIEHDGFSAEEVASHYLDKLGHQTKSPRIMRMIRLAYTLGWLRGIAYVDDGKTPVTISGMDAPTGAESEQPK